MFQHPVAVPHTCQSEHSFLPYSFIPQMRDMYFLFSAGEMCKTLPSLNFGGTLGSDGDFPGACQRTSFM